MFTSSRPHRDPSSFLQEDTFPRSVSFQSRGVFLLTIFRRSHAAITLALLDVLLACVYILRYSKVVYCFLSAECGLPKLPCSQQFKSRVCSDFKQWRAAAQGGVPYHLPVATTRTVADKMQRNDCFQSSIIFLQCEHGSLRREGPKMPDELGPAFWSATK